MKNPMAALPTPYVAYFLLFASMAACGYRPLYGGEAKEPLSVVGARTLVADATVIAEVEAGVRAELARAGALRDDLGWPRIVVEVVRIDIGNAGLAHLGDEATARGTRVRVVARAWLEQDASRAIERETRELAMEEVVAVENQALVESFRTDSALRSAGRRLGHELARSVLGEPFLADTER